MNVEELYNFCLTIKGAEESMPFGEDTVVMKVCGKVFILFGLESEPVMMMVKCSPENAEKLREQYNCVQPAYHMNKTHWNSIYLTGEMPDEEIKQWIQHSVVEVIKKLPKKIRQAYNDTIE
ncbi:MAG: MmcQ/YjbR family DNA-binding protein [Dysgonamonadaceae bacterium]